MSRELGMRTCTVPGTKFLRKFGQAGEHILCSLQCQTVE